MSCTGMHCNPVPLSVREHTCRLCCLASLVPYALVFRGDREKERLLRSERFDKARSCFCGLKSVLCTGKQAKVNHVSTSANEVPMQL